MERTATARAKQDIVRRALRTPRAAAIAGIAFSILFTVALVLIRSAVPSEPDDAGAWLSDSSRREAVLSAVGLVPFAGIAFLWFIGVVRDRVGAAEDRFFATIFLGSGLLFVAMLFAWAAVAAALVASVGDDGETLLTADAWKTGQRVTYELMTVYAMRMAAVFTTATSTILLRTGVGPRWAAFTGYVVSVFLLLTVELSPWIKMLFPAWVLVISLYILVLSFKRGHGGFADAVPAD